LKTLVHPDRKQHEQVQELLLHAQIVPLSDADHACVEEHLFVCDDCATSAGDLDAVTRQLRALPVFASPDLVRATQSRLRTRARQINQERWRTAPMLLVCGLVVVFTILAAPFAWFGVGWLAEEFGMSMELQLLSFFLFYLIPAGASITLAMLHHRKSQQEEWARR